MSYIKLRASNVAPFSNGAPAYLIGKNGFNTELGVVPVYVTDVNKINSESRIEFVIRGLDELIDDNTGDHILESMGFTGENQISYRVLLNETETDFGDVAYVDPYVTASSNILSYNTGTNTVVISNPTNGDSDLYSKIESTPFYSRLYQTLSVDTFPERSVFVSGTTLNGSKVYNIYGLSDTYVADIGISPEDKRFISVYIDGKIQNPGTFSWDDRANISVDLSNSATELRILYSKYTVPVIERGDNISIIFSNTYSVINASYLTNTSKYDSSLTTKNIFKIYLSEDLRFNATGFIATNVSPDPNGVLGNVDTSVNTFTLDYNGATYPGNFQLANNYVYKVISGKPYTPLLLPDGRTVYDVPPGLISVRARNVNPAGRKSSFATSTIEVGDVILPAVENIQITESLYFDTTQGIATRATVSFDHNPSKQIIGYELSYKVEGEAAETADFLTVQVPTTAVGSDGRLSYIINNIDRGRSSGVNYLVVRITPINNAFDGITKQVIQTIIGKTAQPANVNRFSYAQNTNLLTLFWEFELNSDNTLRDLDLQEVEIRRVAGNLTTAEEFLVAWNGGNSLATVAIPSTNHTFIIDSFGQYTFLIKTRDTSRNESDDVQGISVNLQRPTNLSAYRTWSEDAPSANNSVSFVSNNNYFEYNWPSFANSDNTGLYYVINDPITPGVGPSTLVENANGTSSGFSVGPDSTDLISSSNAFYQTQVRDIGSVVLGRFTTDVNIYSILTSTWLGMRENVAFGVSDIVPTANILWDEGSGLGTTLATSHYKQENKTLTHGGSFGDVYAIWNSGQFADDTSNANSFALIAGVINADAVALGGTYFAGGVSTGSNLLPNLTTHFGSYQLVNLKQWGDEEGLGNWQGPDGLISYNTEIRYSTSNPYFQVSNANINVRNFTSTANVGNFLLYNGGEVESRWFQLRVWVTNQNPSLASAVFDKLRYTADLTNKTFTAVINVQANPTIVDLSAQNFKATPVVTLTPIISVPLRINNTFPSYSPINSNSTQANITVYSNTGVFVPNTLVNFSATGF